MAVPESRTISSGCDILRCLRSLCSTSQQQESNCYQYSQRVPSATLPLPDWSLLTILTHHANVLAANSRLLLIAVNLCLSAPGVIYNLLHLLRQEAAEAPAALAGSLVGSGRRRAPALLGGDHAQHVGPGPSCGCSSSAPSTMAAILPC